LLADMSETETQEQKSVEESETAKKLMTMSVDADEEDEENSSEEEDEMMKRYRQSDCHKHSSEESDDSEHSDESDGSDKLQVRKMSLQTENVGATVLRSSSTDRITTMERLDKNIKYPTELESLLQDDSLRIQQCEIVRCFDSVQIWHDRLNKAKSKLDEYVIRSRGMLHSFIEKCLCLWKENQKVSGLIMDKPTIELFIK